MAKNKPCIQVSTISRVLSIASLLFLSSCDCVQKASGIVLDKTSGQPLAEVAAGKFKTEDPNNGYSRRIYTDSTGHFEYHGLSGGLGRCPDLVLYFSKDNYKTLKMTFSNMTGNDTIYLEKLAK
jgi:hypothetical protein